MAYVVIVVAALLLAGCAFPSKTRPWCAPAGKHSIERHATSIGVRCAF